MAQIPKIICKFVAQTQKAMKTDLSTEIRKFLETTSIEQIAKLKFEIERQKFETETKKLKSLFQEPDNIVSEPQEEYKTTDSSYGSITDSIIALLKRNPDGFTNQEMAEKTGIDKKNIQYGTAYLLNQSRIESRLKQGTNQKIYTLKKNGEEVQLKVS